MFTENNVTVSEWHVLVYDSGGKEVINDYYEGKKARDNEFKNMKDKHDELDGDYKVLYRLSKIDVSELDEGQYTMTVCYLVDGEEKPVVSSLAFEIAKKTTSREKKPVCVKSTYGFGLDQPITSAFNAGEGIYLTGWIYAPREYIDTALTKNAFAIKFRKPDGMYTQLFGVSVIEGIEFGFYERSDIDFLVMDSECSSVNADLSRTGFYIWIKNISEVFINNDVQYGLKFGLNNEEMEEDEDAMTNECINLVVSNNAGTLGIESRVNALNAK